VGDGEGFQFKSSGPVSPGLVLKVLQAAEMEE
jgi:hypothetical protein